MANTFDPSTDGFPDPADMVAGTIIKAAPHRALTGGINYAHANVYAQTVAAQGWVEDDIVCRAGAKATVTQPWAVPVLTPRHRLRCEVYAKGIAAAGGTVYFANQAGTEVAIPIAAGGSYAYASATLQLASSGYDRVVMKIASATGTVTIQDVNLEFEPLTSPLATSAIGSFVPFGETASAADFPLSAQRGYQMITGLDAIASRYRVLFSLAGLVTSNLGSPSLGSAYLMPDADLYQHVTTHIGALDAAAAAYRVAALVNPHSTADTVLDINASIDPTWETEGAIGDHRYTVTAAGTGATWITTTFRIPEGTAVPGVDYPTAKVGLVLADWQGAATPPDFSDLDRVSNARIQSLVLYGV